MVKLKGGRFACASKDFCFVLLRLAKVLDSVSSASDLAKLETIYELTLDALKATANQRPLRFEREGQPPSGSNTEFMLPDCDNKK